MTREKKLPGSKGAKKAKKQVSRSAVPTVVPKRVSSHFAAPDHVSWRFSMIDTGGPWCCHDMDGALVPAVLTKLREYESMTLPEILAGKAGGKAVPAGGICAEAAARLREIRLDDASHLFEFHLQGLWRVWAIQVGAVFHLLWWDPGHSVWPSEKKHT